MSTPSSAPKPAQSNVDLIGYSLAIGGAALFATKGILIKLAYSQGASTEIIMSLRMIVALPVYMTIFVVLLTRNPDAKKLFTPGRLFATMAVGTLGYYFSSYLDISGLAFVSAQYERLVLFTYPFFVLLFGVWFFGDQMNWKLVPAMVLSYLGLMVIFAWNLTTSPDGLLIGTALVLGSALTFALYQHLARAQMVVLGSALFTCIGMSTAAVFAIAQSLIMDGPAAYGELSLAVWFYGLMLGIFGTVLPSFMLNAGIARIGARATSSTAAFGPIITIVLAVVILDEDFTWFHAVGTALVMIGTAWFAKLDSRKRPARK